MKEYNDEGIKKQDKMENLNNTEVFVIVWVP